VKLEMRIPVSILRQARDDLVRQHPFAFERVGFIFARHASSSGQVLILANRYEAVPDEDYVPDESVGARIGAAIIRRMLQTVLNRQEGIFHVHMHDHPGTPGFGLVDKRELAQLIPPFCAVASKEHHGAVLLSRDRVICRAWSQGAAPIGVTRVSSVGYPLETCCQETISMNPAERFSRQSFLGAESTQRIASAQLAIVGVGGGGSHVVQQLGHVGFTNLRLFDAQRVEDSNLNRLVGATEEDVTANRLKVDVAARLLLGLNREAQPQKIPSRWQEAADALRECEIVIGCVDGFSERNELEAFARRHLMPYVDIGLDVHQVEGEPPQMAGQVVLSMPGYPCMKCMGILSEANLAREMARYGVAGPRPQVVWANGVLGSLAVGVVVDLVTGWSSNLPLPLYLSFDANQGTVVPHVRLRFIRDRVCPHYSPENVGAPRFTPL